MLKRMAVLLDTMLVTDGRLSIEQKAEIVGLLRECDEGMYIDHSRRGYLELIRTGKLRLERVVPAGGG